MIPSGFPSGSRICLPTQETQETQIQSLGHAPLPEDLPDQVIEPASPVYLAMAGGFLNTSIIWEAHHVQAFC